MTLMSIWAACQPRPVTPQPGDVVKDGRCYRRINGEWAVYNAQAGDWYRCVPGQSPDGQHPEAAMAEKAEEKREYPCPAWSDDGDSCILDAGHKGNHQRRPCDGTCDTCECDFWPDEDNAEAPNSSRSDFCHRHPTATNPENEKSAPEERSTQTIVITEVSDDDQ